MDKGSIKFWWDKTLVIVVEDVDKGLGNIFTPNVNGNLEDKFWRVNRFNLINNSFSHAVYRCDLQDMKNNTTHLIS